jgi:hypothetical protein
MSWLNFIKRRAPNPNKAIHDNGSDTRALCLKTYIHGGQMEYRYSVDIKSQKRSYIFGYFNRPI